MTISLNTSLLEMQVPYSLTEVLASHVSFWDTLNSFSKMIINPPLEFSLHLKTLVSSN